MIDIYLLGINLMQQCDSDLHDRDGSQTQQSESFGSEVIIIGIPL